MKKLVILLVITILTLQGFSQESVKKGLRIGRGGTTTFVDTTSLKRILQILTLDEANASYLPIPDTTDLETVFYTKPKIDSMRVLGQTYYETLRAMNTTIKTLTVGAQAAGFAGGALLTDGYIPFTKLKSVPYSQTLSSLKFIIATAGNYTPDNENRVCLIKLVGTTYTIVASTANDTADPNIFEAANSTIVTATFTTPYVAAANEDLYVGFLYNSSAQTTAPILYGVTNGNAAFNTPSFWGISSFITGRVTATGNNTLPASFVVADCTQSAYSYLVTVF